MRCEKHDSAFPMRLLIVSFSASHFQPLPSPIILRAPPPPSLPACLPASARTEKRRRFFSWETLGEVCCPVRVESRFSGSSLTPCSAIASRTRCHGRCRVRTRRRLSPVPAQPDPWWFLAAYSAMRTLRFGLAVFGLFFFSPLSLCVHHLTSRCDFEIVSRLS